MLPLLTNDHHARNLLTHLARHLRQAALQEGAAPGRDGSGGHAAIRSRLARAMLRLAQEDPLLTAMIDLRLFARLRLRECAALLQRQPRELASAWRQVRDALACASPRRPTRPDVPPSGSLD